LDYNRQMSKTPAAKPKPSKHKKYLLVRHGQMSTLGLFEHNEPEVPKVPTRVVVKTEKGIELGYLVGQLTAYRAGQFRFSPDQLHEYFENSEIEYSCEPVGRFVRYATPADISEERHLRQIVKDEIETCNRFINELNLPMEIVDAEHILGGERIVFYFKADGRIDFRELVKKLAREYQTRIEMRQIGSRDEAKILGDVESCGQQCCCQRFLKALKPVNMRMAKMQKATLDPSKISGYCGRLKCCLRYEDQTYTELKKRLPKKNSQVRTPRGQGKVIDAQILTQLVVVEYENGDREAVGVEDIELIKPPPKPAKQQRQTEDKKPDSAQQVEPEGENINGEDEMDEEDEMDNQQ
jgi:cell fate regulator YaaT (PSP1 superfamily)